MVHAENAYKGKESSLDTPAVNHNWSVAISPLCLHDAADDSDDIGGVVNLAVGPPVQQVKVTHTVSLTRLSEDKREVRVGYT